MSKTFGSIHALQPLDLEIAAGELVAFLGPSGCGKTTTLLLVAGIYKPSAGEIYFDDERVDPLHPRDRDVGMVFQSYALYPHLTLYENIAFPLRLKRTAKTTVAQKVEQNASLLGIAEQLGRRPGQVSGGQQQRAALARALVKEPRLLLLDEPLSNLDAQIRLQARGEIRRLQQELGITSILVTHDQAEALAMADRVAVFRLGSLQQYASPDELYRCPANTFVASFVGYPPMNLLAGEVTADGFVSSQFRLKVPPGWPQGPATVGIRPEDICLGAAAPGISEVLEGRVVVSELLGREALMTVEVGGATLKAIGPQLVAPNTRSTLGIPTDKLHLFGAEGKRVAA
ncbi:MAG TPA: ABC transporter ATP-binding protein [Trueperaceae bacterium]